MRRIAAMAAAALLSGCGIWSDTIRSNVIDYSNVIEDTADKFLLVDILEASNGAPLHFVDMPKINGTLQATASLTAGIPFGPRRVGTGASSVLSETITPVVSVQSTPTFEVDNLDTKDFAAGMTSAIDPKQVKYWIDRGLDKRVLMFLFFSSVEITGPACPVPGEDPAVNTTNGKASDAEITAYKNDVAVYKKCLQQSGPNYTIKIDNDPRMAADQLKSCQTIHSHDADADADADDACHAVTQFEHYLKLINSIDKNFVAHEYSERSLLAENQKIDPNDIADFDPAQYQLEYVSDKNLYNVYSASGDKKIALCLGGAKNPLPANCTQSIVTDKTTSSPHNAAPNDSFTDPGTNCSNDPRTPPIQQSGYCKVFLGYLNMIGNDNSPYKIAPKIRSAAEIVRFLGDILYYQKQVLSDKYHNMPVTLDYSKDCTHPNSNCLGKDGGALFRVNGDDGQQRFSVSYQGKNYSIAQASSKDHTLEMLAVLSLSIALNRSPNDVHPTNLLQSIN